MMVTNHPIRRGRRRGLATLELVLSLPILLFVMALMINYGTVASWKVRGLCIARNAVWGNRPPRSTANFPRATDWPAAGSMGTVGLPAEGQLEGNAPAPVPDATLLDPGGLIVAPQSNVVDPTLGLVEGVANLARPYPMLQKLGRYNLNAQTELLDNKWDFQQMGLAGNDALRIPILYTLPPAPNQQMYAQKYQQAAMAILNMLGGSPPGIGEPAIWPLDRERDFITYEQIIGRSFPISGVPDFHPPNMGAPGQLPTAPTPAAAKALADLWVYGTPETAGLIDAIQGSKGTGGVAKNMTTWFLLLYTAAIQADPRLSEQLQQNIIALNQFLQTL